MAESLAASLAPIAGPGTDRDGRPAPRPSAGRLHLARRASPREARRWSRADLRRMVEARRRALRGARLFPGRGRGGRALLDLSRRRWRRRRAFRDASLPRSGTKRRVESGATRRGRRDRLAPLVPARDIRMSAARYAELQCTSHFSFLRGASSCEELFAGAAKLGIEALAIVDRNSLAGIVRAHEAAKTTGVRLITGCRLDLADGMSVLVYPADRPAYARLCRLLSLGKKRGGKAQCRLDWSDVIAYGEDLIAVLVPDEAHDVCAPHLR